MPLATLSAVVLGLLLASTPAFAAAPEAPKAETPAELRATTATLNGLLEPNQETGTFEMDTYEFVYRQSSTACKGAGEIKGTEGLALGGPKEPVSQAIEGLAPATTYAVCLLEHNESKTEVAMSNIVTFTTATPPQTPKAEAATVIKAATVTLHGELNPAKEAEVGYHFLYSTEPTCGSGTETEAVTPAKVKAKTKVEAKVAGLQPNKKYLFCLVAANAAGETATSNELTFTTLAAPPEITSESASNVKATEATLEGAVNPNNQITECHFQYGLVSGTVSEHEVACSPEFVKGFGEQSVAPMKLNEKGESVPAPISGLEPAQAYQYRIVAKNGNGEESTGPVRAFKRLVAPPEKPETQAAESTNTAASLHGLVNPASTSSVSWFFQYAAGASCSAADASTTSVQGPEEVQAHSAEANITGLQPGAQYTTCLVAENEAKETTVGSEISFTTSTVDPTVSEQTLTSVSSTEATLAAKIDPEGSSTTYQVEYESGKRTPEQTLAASTTPVGVQQKLTGLTPATEYHFRFLAKNLVGLGEGPLVTFTTPAAGEASVTLPDRRAYELVSPLDNHGGDVYEAGYHVFEGESIETELPFRAAASGDAFAFVGEPLSTTGGTGNTSSPTGNQYVATRGSTGWTTENVSPLSYHEAFYQAFSSDLSVGVLSTFESPPLAEQAPAGLEDLYNRTTGGTYRPLVISSALPANTGFFYTRKTWSNPVGSETLVYAGASEDNAHALFEAAAALTPAATEVPPEEQNDLYDSTNGTLALVNVLPDGTPRPMATFGAQGAENARSEENRPDFSNVISADGKRVFWSALEPATSETGEPVEQPVALYVREDPSTPSAHTVQLDAAEPGAAGSSGGGRFWTANQSGSRVFFTDDHQLTRSSTAGPGTADLYEYDFERPEGERLVDITGQAGTPAGVQGVIGIGTDGTSGFFVAKGALAAGATAEQCKAASGANTASAQEQLEVQEELEGRTPPGRGCNLYGFRAGEALRFIARLGPRDNSLPGSPRNSAAGTYGDWQASLSARTAQVSTNGQSVTFRSRQHLTGYPSGPVPEVFVYTADTQTLSCASCNPTGAPPLPEGQVAESGPAYEDGGFLPPSLQGTYMPRWLSAEGTRVFFDTVQPLVPQDTNGRQDVYQWEQAGAGSCKQPAGCVSLLSSASPGDWSLLVDASADGSDVFFSTRAQLIPQDHSETVKVYDARVNGGFLEPASGCGSACVGEAPPRAAFASPPTITTTGSGNFHPPAAAPHRPLTRAQKLTAALRQCKRYRRRTVRLKCERAARKRYGLHRSAKRARGTR